MHFSILTRRRIGGDANMEDEEDSDDEDEEDEDMVSSSSAANV